MGEVASYHVVSLEVVVSAGCSNKDSHVSSSKKRGRHTKDQKKR
jgi:hypothetical protein